MASRRTDFTVDWHETWNIQIQCHDDNDAVFVSDLSNCTISIAISDLLTQTLILQKGGVILSPPIAGLAMIQILASDQDSVAAPPIVPGRYTYTIRLVRADGTVSDQSYGNITVRGTEYH